MSKGDHLARNTRVRMAYREGATRRNAISGTAVPSSPRDLPETEPSLAVTLSVAVQLCCVGAAHARHIARCTADRYRSDR